MNKNMSMIIKGYTEAMKWIKKNVACDTFTLKWYEITSGRDIVILVETVTFIDINQQVASEYFLNVNNEGVVTWKK